GHGAGGRRPRGRRRDSRGGHGVRRDVLSPVRRDAQRAGRQAGSDRRGMRGAEGREPVITVDGPAAAGKSTVGQRLAERLGYRFIDTGAMYRALALSVDAAGLSPDDEARLRAHVARVDVRLEGGRLFLDGRDVTTEIRTPRISELTSRLTRLTAVREKITPLQRRAAALGGVVLEGRDTGTVVCPDAGPPRRGRAADEPCLRVREGLRRGAAAALLPGRGEEPRARAARRAGAARGEPLEPARSAADRRGRAAAALVSRQGGAVPDPRVRSAAPAAERAARPARGVGPRRTPDGPARPRGGRRAPDLPRGDAGPGGYAPAGEGGRGDAGRQERHPRGAGVRQRQWARVAQG